MQLLSDTELMNAKLNIDKLNKIHLLIQILSFLTFSKEKRNFINNKKLTIKVFITILIVDYSF